MARNPKVRANLSRQYRKISPTSRGCTHPYQHAVNPAGTKLWNKCPLKRPDDPKWRGHKETPDRLSPEAQS